jgi:cell wall-associated NlpC family hydrolase
LRTGSSKTIDSQLLQTVATHAYAGDDPVNESDPSGLSVNLSGAASWALENLHKGDNGFGNDCTDFVSRALAFGGGDPETRSADFYWDALHKDDMSVWFQVQDLVGFTETSFTWANAHALAEHMQGNGSQFLASSLDLKSTNQSGCSPDSSGNPTLVPIGVEPGDLIFANWSGADFAGISHVGILVSQDGQLVIAQHTPDHIDSLGAWQNYGSDTHVWIVRSSAG